MRPGSGAPPWPPRRSRLYRDPKQGRVLGVCRGLADYFGFNTALVRLIAVVGLIFFTVPTLVCYFLLGWILDPVPADLFHTVEEEDFWRKVRTDPGQTFAGLKHRFRAMELSLRAMEAHVTSREFQMDQELRGGNGGGGAQS